MQNVNSERGGSTLGCLLSLAAFVLFAYVAYQLVPIMKHSNDFETRVEQEVGRAAAKYVGDDVLKRNILNLAAVNQIPLKEGDMQITRAPSQLAVDLKYSIKVDFPFYSHIFNFKFRATSVTGAL